MMTEDNVVKLPTELVRLFEDAHRAVAMGAEGEHKSIESRLLLMVSLAAIKAKFKDNISFGKSCTEHGLGENVISAVDRAILIQWAEKPEWTRTVLEKTDYKSIRRIHDNDWRLSTGAKTEENQKPAGGPKLQEAKDKILAYEAVEGKLPPADRHFQMEGVTPSTYDRAIREVRGARAQAEALGPLKPSKTTAIHIEAIVARRLRELEREFSERVRLALLERNADYRELLEKSQKEASEKWERYDNLINSHKPIFNETEFITILTCLHPDNSASVEKRNIAFRAFNAMKFQLTGKR